MKLVHVVGARPQFIKMGPVHRALQQAVEPGCLDEIVVHTGQHYDHRLSGLLFDELGLPAPELNLQIGSATHGAQTGRMLESLEAVFQAKAPDIVVVYGDTNSTLAGTLAAVKLHVPVAHVEAGLRSYNRRMPEEVNRVLTDHASDLLLCPSAAAVANLRSEGVVSGVHLVGDVMFDSVLHNVEIARQKSTFLDEFNLSARGYVLATIHRAENTDDAARLGRILSALDRLAGDLPVILPLHPRTRAAIHRFGLAVEKMTLTEPLGYLGMLRAVSEARCVVTDSGGVQKEAFFLRVPCVTVRDETEWTETTASGWNVLVGTDPERIVEAVRSDRQRHEVTPYGNGDAGPRVVRHLLEFVRA